MDVVGPGAGRLFLDVGSGIGSKLFLASQSGWEAHGLESRAEYALVSKQLFPDLPVELGDAFAYQAYDQFDLIYSYRLCVDPDHQDCLNDIIAKQMKPGALFFSAGGPWPDWLEHVGGQVWRTPS
jgi:SAM-dependent methyltransferase